jgi:hypothetical protein
VSAFSAYLLLREDPRHATDRRADEDPRARRVDAVHARVLPGLARRGDGEDDVALQAPRILRADDGDRVEVLHLGGDPNWVPGRVEGADEVDAAASRDRSFPRRARIEAERGDRSEAGDRNPTHAARA